MTIDTKSPCPKCGEKIQLGNGVQRDGKRLHYWCAVTLKDRNGGETRLPSGVTV